MSDLPASRVTLGPRALPALVAALLWLAPQPADAQLGRLKKMGGDLVKDAAKDAATGKKPADPTAPAKGASATARYDVTAERIDAVLAALAPLAARAEQETEGRRLMRAYTVKDSIATQCMTKAMQAYAANPTLRERTAAEEAKDEALRSTAERLAGEMSDASLSRRDPLRYAFIADSLKVLQMTMPLLLTGASCDIPYMPPSVVAYTVAERTRTSSASEDGKYEVPAAARGGMTGREFAMVRERIALWALVASGSGKTAAEGAGSLGTFTEAEQAALQAKAADLKKLAPFFQNGTLRWATGDDLRSW